MARPLSDKLQQPLLGAIRLLHWSQETLEAVGEDGAAEDVFSVIIELRRIIAGSKGEPARILGQSRLDGM